MNVISDIMWARLAMAIDCEGNISIGKHPSYPNSPRRNSTYFAEVKVTNTSEAFIDWLVNNFGLHKHSHDYNNGRWKSWHVARATSKVAYVVLQGIRPFLLIKGKQADLALELQKSMTENSIRGRPVPREVHLYRDDLWLKARELNKKGPNSD